MPTRRWPWAAALIAAAALVISLPLRGASEEEAREVRVVNFPATQRILGTVSVPQPIPQAALTSILEVEVPPVKPDDPRRLIQAGTLETDGFTGVVLNLAVEARGNITTQADVGAILVPDQELVLKVLDERGLLQFPLEVRAAPPLRALYFTSEPVRATVAFPRYRVLLFNATERTVKVSLYAYLTS